MTKSSFQARGSYLVGQKLHIISVFLQQNKNSPFLFPSTRQLDKPFWLVKMEILSKRKEKQTFMFFTVVPHDCETRGKVMHSMSVRVRAWALHTVTLCARFAPLKPNHFSSFDLFFFFNSPFLLRCHIIIFSKIFHGSMDAALEIFFIFLSFSFTVSYV